MILSTSWHPWRILLIAAMGEALDDDERVIFRKITGREREPLERCEELWGIVGRRGGKSRAIATLAVYLACFVDYGSVVAIGERLVVLCLAQNAKQAGVVFSYIVGILDAVPMLAKLIKNKTVETLSLANGVEIEVRAAHFRGIRGITAAAIIWDEMGFWFTDDTGSQNPDSEILNAARPALATTNGILACISSPYARRGEAYDTWLRHYGAKGDPRILIAQGASRDFNPSLPERVVARALERDPLAARAEYLAEWRSDIEGFVSFEAVQAVIDKGVIERAPEAGLSYVAFVDAAGGSGADSYTCAIAHRDGENAVLDAVREAKPPFSPEDITREFASFVLTYRIKQVRGDRYAGEWPAEQFRKWGVDYQPSAKPKSDIYNELLPMVNSKRALLLDNGRLISQLTSLERRTSRGGRDSVDHPQGSHDDLANSAAGALVMLNRQAEPGFIAFYRAEAAKYSE